MSKVLPDLPSEISNDPPNISSVTPSINDDSPEVWPTPFDDEEYPDLPQTDEEILESITKNKSILLRTVTWNMNAKVPSKGSLTYKLIPKKFHVYMIGTQECERSIAKSALNTSKKGWEDCLKESFGSDYVPIRSHTLQALHMICFVHKAISPYCSLANSHAFATGMGNTLGNKGAVCIFLNILDIKMLVVTAHLSAHQGEVETRNTEFHKINQIMAKQLKIKIEKESKIYNQNNNIQDKKEKKIENDSSTIDDQTNTPLISEEKDNISPSEETPLEPSETVSRTLDIDEDDDDEDDDDENDNINLEVPEIDPVIPNFSDTKLKDLADVVIFMGDLNYRVNGNRSILDKLLLDDMYSVLLNNDQLKNSMKRGLCFNEFTEAKLTFRPTYKFNVNSDEYDSGPKKRLPSWTDRILYINNPKVLKCLSYHSDTSLKISDHKPVYATFKISIDQLNEGGDGLEYKAVSQVCVIS